MRDIICLSTQYWDGPWFRKQQFTSRAAATGARVLFVEPSHSVLRRTTYLGTPGNPIVSGTSREVAERLMVFTPPRGFPKPNLPTMSRLNRRLLVRGVLDAARGAGLCEDPLVLVYDVEWASSVARLTSGPIVLDLVDDLVDYEVSASRRSYVDACIRSLVARSSASVFTTRPLLDRYKSDGVQRVIPNGFDERLFHRGVVPRRVQGATGAVIGFVGTLFRHIDYDALLALAQALPETRLVLVGREEGMTPKLEELKAQPNVLALGAVTPAEVPPLVAGFDVCVAPFAAGRVADAVSPLKIYEYLAMGKRVVCSELAGVRGDSISGLVDFARTPEEFVERVRFGLRHPQLDAGWEEIVSTRSWSALYEEFAAVSRIARDAR